MASSTGSSTRCSSNAECIRRGLPLKRPRGLTRLDRRTRRKHPQGRDLVLSYSFDYTGSPQYLVIPQTGRWTVSATGGTGGSSIPGDTVGGNPTIMTADFILTEGTNYTVIVGGNGGGTTVANQGCGGGGASWVYLTPTMGGSGPAQPLLVASGGSGASGYNNREDGRGPAEGNDMGAG